MNRRIEKQFETNKEIKEDIEEILNKILRLGFDSGEVYRDKEGYITYSLSSPKK